MTAHGLLRTTPLYIQTVHSNVMAKRLTVSEVVELLDADEYDDFGLSEEDNSDCEGEDVEGYLPRASSRFVHVEESEESVEEEEMDFEAIVPDDSSSSSDESLNQPSVGKFSCTTWK